MTRIPIPALVAGSVAVVVAAVLSQTVLFRASWLLPPDFDRDAFLVYGNGPMVGLLLVVICALAFWCCRTGLRSLASQLSTDLGHWAKATRFAVLGVGSGIVAGIAIPWLLIAANGMGNGGDTSIVRYEFRDFVESTLFRVGLFLVAVLSVRLRKGPIVAA